MLSFAFAESALPVGGQMFLVSRSSLGGATTIAHRPKTIDHRPTERYDTLLYRWSTSSYGGRFLTYECCAATSPVIPTSKSSGIGAGRWICWRSRRARQWSAVRGRPPLEWERLDYLFTSGKRPNDSSGPVAFMSRLLIVDDSETIVNFLRMILEVKNTKSIPPPTAPRHSGRRINHCPFDHHRQHHARHGWVCTAACPARRSADEAVPVIMLTSGRPGRSRRHRARPATRRIRGKVGGLGRSAEIRTGPIRRR